MRYIIVLVSAMLLCNCAAQKSLQDTVWVNITPAQHGNVQGQIVTSMHFHKRHKVDFNTAVAYNNQVEVVPYRSAEGIYKCAGSIKKGAKIQIDATTVNGAIRYNGRLFPEGMMLYAPDSTVYAYNMVDSVIIYKQR